MRVGTVSVFSIARPPGTLAQGLATLVGLEHWLPEEGNG